jgi:hypothetical protein
LTTPLQHSVKLTIYEFKNTGMSAHQLCKVAPL